MAFKYNVVKLVIKLLIELVIIIGIESLKDNTPKFNIYMMDSGKNVPFYIGYNWIKFTQISWYKRTALNLRQKYKQTIPALMFFHIPLREN